MGHSRIWYHLSLRPGVDIVKEAGGVVLKPDFTNITYNREDVYNRGGYTIANKKENIKL